MEYLVTAAEMKRADERTSTRFGISSIVLMERAALKACERIEAVLPEKKSFLLICGYGNNGGDGIALARLLYCMGKQVTVALVGNEVHVTDSCKKQINSVMAYGIPMLELSEKNIDELPETECIVDAIFGVGINREITGIYRDVIHKINNRKQGQSCVSLDVPSGLGCDTGEVMGCCVKADITITFAYRKKGMLLYPGCDYCGDVYCEQIGIDDASFEGHFPQCITFSAKEAVAFPKRERNGNKGTFGKVLVIAGSYSMAGAALLCGRAAYRVGAGMVKLVTEERNREIVQTSLQEAMLLTYDDNSSKEQWQTFEDGLMESVKWADTIVIGSGIGRGSTAKQLCKSMLECLAELDKPVVFDADALYLLATEEEIAKLCQGVACPKIMTPHMGELAKLAQCNIQELKRTWENRMLQLRQKYPDVIFVCKDARTFVYPALCGEETQIFLNTTGNDGMATAGSGDVLAGMIGGLIHNSTSCLEAARLGVAMHGAMGDRIALRMEKSCIMAGDLIEELGRVQTEAPEWRKK